MPDGMGVPSPTVLALLGCGYARFHAGANFALKLSEKGFERRSERGIGRYIGAKIGRTVRCRGSVQLSFGCLQDFSDSFLTEFSEVRLNIGWTSRCDGLFTHRYSFHGVIGGGLRGTLPADQGAPALPPPPAATPTGAQRSTLRR